MSRSIRKRLVFFLIGLYTILPDYFKIIGQNSALICATVIIIAFYLLGFHSNFRFKKEEILFPVVYLLPSLIIHLVHGEANQAIRALLEYFVLFLIIERLLQSQKDIDDLFDILIGYSVFEAITAVVHFFTDVNIFSFIQSQNLPPFSLDSATQYRMNLVRVEGSFGHAITFAVYLSICACLALYRYNKTKEKIYIYIYILQFVTIILTVSRMPILVFLVSQFIYLLSLNLKKMLKITFRIVLGSVLVMSVLYFIMPQLFQMIDSIFQLVSNVFSSTGLSGLSTFETESAFTYRAEMIRVLPSMIKEHPIIGIGGAAYRSSDFHFLIGGTRQTSIDNEYYHQLLIYGIVGLFSLIWWVFGLHFVDKRKKIRGSKVASIAFYRFLIILVYSLNLFSVAMMFEYKLIIVVYAIFLFDIVHNKDIKENVILNEAHSV